MKIIEYVKKYDPQNQFEVLISSYKQIEYAWNNKFDLGKINKDNFNKVLVTGLGGSAISADLMQNYLRTEMDFPYFVNRNYYLPPFADQNTLVVISSYSGNTEETISVFNEAIKKKCSIVCVTTGGKAEKIAIENGIPVIKIQPGLQPRYALGLSFFSLLRLLQELKLIPDQNEVVNKIINLWKNKGNEFSAEDNFAFNLAESLIGFIPTIYSASDVTSAVGYRLKCQFNENSKLHAFHNVIPELNHNEIIGWESFAEKQFQTKLITILDEEYLPQIKKRFEITTELAAKNGVEIVSLKSEEKEFKLRLLELIYLGDWISYYLAVLRGFDPTEIENINILKKRLS
jgi:glucose/mannose-6-phosphate isomerase